MKRPLVSISMRFALCAGLLAVAQPAAAGPVGVGSLVKFNGSLGTLGGGPFLLDVLGTSDSTDFITFCLQRSQYVDFGQTFRVGGITGAADDAGGPDPISDETAWIYKNYRTGLLGAFSGNAVQAAIWALEESFNAGSVAGASDLLQLASAAVLGGWKNDGQVQVLNLFFLNGQRAQDQLTLATVPEPATLVLLSTGLLGVARMARRRRQRES